MYLFGKGKLFSEIFINFAHVKKRTNPYTRMTGEKHKSDFALQKLTEYLARTGRRNTPERLEILEAAKSLSSGFTTDDLTAAVAARGIRVSRATVYNAVELFVSAGVTARYFVNRGARYEMMPTNRHHLVCLNCGKTKAVKDQSFSEVLRARHYSAFTASYFEMTVYGICSACARKAKKTNINTRIKK